MAVRALEDHEHQPVGGYGEARHDSAGEKRTRAVVSLLAGGVAGALAKTAIAPLDRTKILFQVTPGKEYSVRAMVATVRDIARVQGMASLWRGNSATVLRVFPFAAIQFMAHEQYKGWLRRPGEQSLPPARRFIAGAMAGFTATSLTYPLDLMRARFAVQMVQRKYTSIASAFATMLRDEGGVALFRGLVPTLLGIIPYAGTSFFTYETIKHWIVAQRRLIHDRDISPYERLPAGAIAGLVGQSVTYPLDIVRRRMQTDGFVVVGGERQYHGVWSTLAHVARTEGVRKGLYRGLSLNWVKGPVAVGISFTTFDTLKHWTEALLGLDTQS